MTMSNMKAGTVVSIRVNPRDCQSVLDLCEKAGMNKFGMSFPSMVSLALASLLESARNSNLLPEPDEFAFLERMGRYIKNPHQKKVEVTKQMQGLGPRLSVPVPLALEAPKPKGSAAEPAGFIAETPLHIQPQEDSPEVIEAKRHATRRLTELQAKLDMAEDGKPGVVWSPSDQEEMDAHIRLLYPDG